MDELEGAAKTLKQIEEEVARATSSAGPTRFARDLLRDAAERAAAAFQTAVRPIWGVTEQHRPIARGSCVLLEIGSERLILTAAHVADFVQDSLLYIGLKDLEPLPNAFESTIAPGGDRRKDHIDFAIMRFPPELMAKIGDATFIPEASIGVGEPVEKRTFTCLGYPKTMNKRSPTEPNKVRGKLMSHTSRSRPCSTLAAIAVDGVHLLVDRHAKYARDPDGMKVNSSSGDGMSGGGIFDVGDLGSAKSVILPELPRLAAITTEAFPNKKVILGTRVDAIIRGLRRQNWL